MQYKTFGSHCSIKKGKSFTQPSHRPGFPRPSTLTWTRTVRDGLVLRILESNDTSKSVKVNLEQCHRIVKNSKSRTKNGSIMFKKIFLVGLKFFSTAHSYEYNPRRV